MATVGRGILTRRGRRKEGLRTAGAVRFARERAQKRRGTIRRVKGKGDRREVGRERRRRRRKGAGEQREEAAGKEEEEKLFKANALKEVDSERDLG